MAKDPSAYRRPSAWPGMILFLGGGGLAAATTTAPVPWVAPYAGMSWAFHGFVGGAAVSLIGFVLSFWASTRPPPPQPKVQAHVAFRSKSKRLYDPLKDGGVEEWKPNPRLAKAKPADTDFSDLSADETIDLQIQALKEKIARAKVMFGTGKLSQGGYAKYVKELKDELARLESQRMTSDLGESAAAAESEWATWDAADPDLLK